MASNTAHLDRSLRPLEAILTCTPTNKGPWSFISEIFHLASQHATFEVNNVRYMTYPWTDPETNTSTPPGLNSNSRLNYLLYLETIGQNTPPPDSE
ncbi:unnamed protein product [Fusarium fujikuroi]|uniref:Uncharacterized protein n=1 Tax=Fusarium fujikuroi TaxID=5127 RepID=A0A9Q9RB04_FUSFU|nr:unnamed protein product [Fusarium fujikuroi]VTT58239.1 unnamed protein product [Fusarium fujikuroi]VZI14799.1 unnamed protein product [Fusarium fujikuroi]